jgi:hypothetical protein
MFTKEAFVNVNAAQTKLASLYGTFQYPTSGDIDEINDLLEKVKFGLHIHSGTPKYVLKRALYPNEGANTLQYANFVVQPAAGYKLEIAELKKTFKIIAGANFFDRFIEEMAIFFDEYQYFKQLQENVNALNLVVADLISEHELPFNIKFGLGKGLLDASDTYAVVGIPARVIENLSDLSLFDSTIESRREGYKSRILETLKEINRPIDIVKVKTHVTKELGIYNRRGMHKILRKFVNRKAQFVHTGVGYIESPDWFAVVEKEAVTPALVLNTDQDVLILDNASPSKKELEAGETKIAVTYKLTPFSKKTGESLSLELSAAFR